MNALELRMDESDWFSGVHFLIYGHVYLLDTSIATL